MGQEEGYSANFLFDLLFNSEYSSGLRLPISWTRYSHQQILVPLSHALSFGRPRRDAIRKKAFRNGCSRFRLTLAENSREPSPKKWKNTKQTLNVDALRFTGTPQSLKNSTKPLLSAWSDTYIHTPSLINGKSAKQRHRERSNYCPISVLPILSKIIEKHVANSLLEYLQENNLLYEF